MLHAAAETPSVAPAHTELSVHAVLPPAVIDAIAERAAQIVLDGMGGDGTPYIYGYAAAASYLGGMPVRRLHYLVEAGEIRCYRLPAIDDGQASRSVIFLKSDLDAFVERLRPA